MWPRDGPTRFTWGSGSRVESPRHVQRGRLSSPAVAGGFPVGGPDDWFLVSYPGLSLQFLLGWKDDEAVLVGGEWSPSLDGLDPKGDPQVLVRTATRCAQAQTGIDLSACTKW